MYCVPFPPRPRSCRTLPKVYLAELMSHFFPGRDLAPHPSSEEAASIRARRERAAREKHGLDEASASQGGSSGRPKGPTFGGIKFSGLRRSIAGVGVPAAAVNFSATAASPTRNHASLSRLRGTLRPNLWGGGMASGATEDVARKQTPDKDNRDDKVWDSEDKGNEVLREKEVQDNASARPRVHTSRPNLGAMLERARHGGGRDAGQGGQPPPRVNDDHAGRHTTAGAMEPTTMPPVRTQLPPETRGGQSRMSPHEPGAQLSSMLPDTTAKGIERLIAKNSALRHRNDDDHGGATTTTVVDNAANLSIDKAASTYIGDNHSTTQQRKRGNIIVYVPRSPDPGVWAASVEFDGARDIEWVLAEALRMYGREHSPVTVHAGLARRPRRVQRSPGRWGWFQGSNEWEQSQALPATSPVHSVLTPGEELVVLVEGFDPAAAFDRRVSICVPPHVQDDAAPADGREGIATDQYDVESRGAAAAFSLLGEQKSADVEGFGGDHGGGKLGQAKMVACGRGVGDVTPDAILPHTEHNDNAGPIRGEAVSTRESNGRVGRFRGIIEQVGSDGVLSVPASRERNIQGESVDGRSQGGLSARAAVAVGTNGQRRLPSDWGESDDNNHDSAVRWGDLLVGGRDAEASDDDDDTLTAEEETEQSFCNPLHGHFYEAAALPEISPATSQRGIGWRSTGAAPRILSPTPSSRNNVDLHRTTEDGAATSSITEGLTGRNEVDDVYHQGDGGDNRAGRLTPPQGGGAEGGNDHAESVSESRSPPRSLMSAMFSTWGGN